MSKTATYVTVDLYFRDREKHNDGLKKLSDRFDKFDEQSFNHENLLSEGLIKQRSLEDSLKELDERSFNHEKLLSEVSSKQEDLEDSLKKLDERSCNHEKLLSEVSSKQDALEVMLISMEVRTANSTKSGLWEKVKWFPIHADKSNQWPEDAPDTAQGFWLLEHERKSSMRQYI